MSNSIFRVPTAVCNLMVVLTGCLLASAAAGQDSPPASNGAPADPIGAERVVEPPLRSGGDDSITPDHPPIDEIPPMKMPTAQDRRAVSPDGGDAIIHDAEIGRTQRVGVGAPRSGGGARGGQSFRGMAEELREMQASGQRGFGTKSLISDAALQSFPRSPNVKLVMRFVDVNGNDVFFNCSGTMWDAGVVLTAGHCVHAAHDPNRGDWAEEIWVYPAWDGGGTFVPGANDHRDFWGWARGTVFGAFTGWTEDADNDWDIGMIRLRRTGAGDRQVGMLTGWLAWAYGFDCSTIQGRTYHNFSYPAENCPTVGLHNGRDMYYWNGSIDSCPSGGRQMQINTGNQCLNAMWGGESGSSVYYIDGDDRFAHGVASTSDRSSVGNYAKLWLEFKDYFTDTFRPNTRGSDADWELMRFRTGNTLLAAGGRTQASTVRVANATNADPAGATFTLRVYLSTNNNVTSADTLLASFFYSVDFSAMETRTFNVPEVTIPAGLAPGTYWLGAELEVSGDLYDSNNNVWGWDAQEVEVRDPDLFEDRFEN